MTSEVAAAAEWILACELADVVFAAIGYLGCHGPSCCVVPFSMLSTTSRGA